MKRVLLFSIMFALCLSRSMAQTVTDHDGNVYKTITIGTQVWMKENLKVKHYRNGDSIMEVRDSAKWPIQTKGAWCYFNNNPANGAVYGNLYNWYAGADIRGLAPPGWHVPTDAEWKTLEMYLGMSATDADKTDWRGTDQGAQLKETDTIHWRWPTGNVANNASGFTALGGGWRIYFLYPGADFVNLTNTGEWWTSTARDATTGWLRNLCAYHPDVYRTAFGKTQGCSVRCIRDAPAGTKDLIEQDFDLFPNPAQDKVYVHSNVKQSSKIELYNILGDCVLQKNLNNQTTEIDISNQPGGIYFMKVISSKGVSQKKLIKE